VLFILLEERRVENQCIGLAEEEPELCATPLVRPQAGEELGR
jgi:hypothetical protein